MRLSTGRVPPWQRPRVQRVPSEAPNDACDHRALPPCEIVGRTSASTVSVVGRVASAARRHAARSSRDAHDLKRQRTLQASCNSERRPSGTVCVNDIPHDTCVFLVMVAPCFHMLLTFSQIEKRKEVDGLEGRDRLKKVECSDL